MDITKMTVDQLEEMGYRNGYLRYERTTKDNPKMAYEEWKKIEEEKDEELP